jgi:hypothetical protein
MSSVPPAPIPAPVIRPSVPASMRMPQEVTPYGRGQLTPAALQSAPDLSRFYPQPSADLSRFYPAASPNIGQFFPQEASGVQEFAPGFQPVPTQTPVSVSRRGSYARPQESTLTGFANLGRAILGGIRSLPTPSDQRQRFYDTADEAGRLRAEEEAARRRAEILLFPYPNQMGPQP